MNSVPEQFLTAAQNFFLMICVLSFLVFGVLGIFFTGYRELARQSLNCMVQRAKTGECDADFEAKLKATVVGKAMDRNRKLAWFINNYMEQISWILIIILLVSAFFAIQGIYNYLVFGNCAGAGATGGCSLDKISGFNLTAEIRESINFWWPE